MVQKIVEYRCEIDGRIFKTEEEAITHEEMMKDIKNTFSFYKEDNDDGCRFSNGRYAIQRDEETYNKLLDSIIAMINKYEKWVLKYCYEDGITLQREHIKGYSYLGRFLDDGHSPLYYWWGIQANICPVCFREYGQIYYASNCTHDIVTKDIING